MVIENEMDHLDNMDVFDDSSPYVIARSTLVELDDQLESNDIEMLKFLCAKLISASKLEKIKRGLHLFENLELLWGFKIRDGQLDPNFVRNIVELLYLIQRNDLLAIFKYDIKRIEAEISHNGSKIDDFWKLLYRLCDVLPNEFEIMKSIAKPYLTSSQYEKIQSSQALFVHLVRVGVISKSDLTLLNDMLALLKRDDLMSDIAQFKRNEELKHCLTLNHAQTPARPLFENQDDENEKNHPTKKVFDLFDPQIETMKNVQTSYCKNRSANITVLRSEAKPVESTEPEVFKIADKIVEKIAFSYNQCPNKEEPKPFLKEIEKDNKPIQESVSSRSELYSNLPLSVISARSPTKSPEIPAIPLSSPETHLPHIIQACPESGGNTGNIRNVIPKLWLQREREEINMPHYCMKTNPKGIMVIINNEKFEPDPRYENLKKLDTREGTNVDRDKMIVTFTKFGFEVRHYDNVSSTTIHHIMRQISLEDHRKYSCFACCLLSHGDKGVIYGTDCVAVSLADITDYFRVIHCPSLRERPKLFFIQACQGQTRDGGYSVTDIETDGPGKMIANDSDFLISYATVPGYVSFRSKEHGSWYITSLTNMLEQYGNSLNILDILLKVNEHVSGAIAKIDGGKYKQMPAPTFTLTKRLFLFDC